MISPVSPVNFKGKYTVMVPKESFEEPKDLKKCEDEFESRFSAELYEGKNFFQRRKHIFFAFLEAPMYPDVLASAKFGLHWIRMHTGIDIKSPKNEDYHSFVVVTKDEGEKMYEKTKSKRYLNAMSAEINQEAEERLQKDLCADEVWENARTYVAFNKLLDECTENSGPEETIILNNLDEIPYAISEMDI